MELVICRILRLTVAREAQAICYADDILLLVEGRTEQEVHSKSLLSIETMVHWMQANGLEVGAQNTEVVLLYGWERSKSQPFEELVPLEPQIVYLGMTVNKS